VETGAEIREIMVALAGRYAFGEIAFLIGAGATGFDLSQREIARVQQLCAYGQRLFDLDAEDFARADAADGANTETGIADLVGDEMVPEYLVRRGALCRIRQVSTESQPDALVSLRPAYRLLLEVIEQRWRRRETLPLLAAVHIAAEYAALLAWEPVLGHAGDPVQLRHDPAFVGPGSRWGDLDDRHCPHTRPEKSAARRCLRVAIEPPSGWQSYLDRQHSSVSHALGVCAAICHDPCTVVERQNHDNRVRLAQACRIALAFGTCALVRMRHAAPVGHGFGVPSPAEVTEAWERSRVGLAKRGGIGSAALAEDGFPLPGLPSLFSGIAGAPIAPDTLLADTKDEIITALSPAVYSAGL
jgi:hypothetical protein